MKFLHSMVRVRDLDASMKFYVDALGLIEVRRSTHEAGRFTLVYLAAPGDEDAQVELTYNWPDANGQVEDYGSARNFGHIAYGVDDIYALCKRLQEHGVIILRPPRIIAQLDQLALTIGKVEHPDQRRAARRNLRIGQMPPQREAALGAFRRDHHAERVGRALATPHGFGQFAQLFSSQPATTAIDPPAIQLGQELRDHFQPQPIG